jgi:hypothetical protein
MKMAKEDISAVNFTVADRMKALYDSIIFR